MRKSLNPSWAPSIRGGLKPYDLVAVEWKLDGIEITTYGQVISRPMLPPRGASVADTIMVRMVPDDPTTLVEVSVGRLRKPSVKSKYVHYARASGSFSFPLDMLRYDACAPVSYHKPLEEGEELLKWARFLHTLKTRTCRPVIVANASAKARPSWTSARWASFGWRIEPLKTLKIGEGQ